MNVDEYWLNDSQLTQLSRQSPSTQFGNELMSKWPQRYPGLHPGLLSSDTCRDCAIVLSALSRLLRGKTMTTGSIERTIEAVDESLRASRNFIAGTDRLGGATLTLTNAWESAHSGVPAYQMVEAYESEAIFAAQMFVKAR